MSSNGVEKSWKWLKRRHVSEFLDYFAMIRGFEISLKSRIKSSIVGRAWSVLAQHSSNKPQSSFVNQRTTSGSVGRFGRIGPSLAIARMIAISLLSSYNGAFSVNISKTDMANEYTSDALLGDFPSTISGAIHRTPSWSLSVVDMGVLVMSWSVLAMPKSLMQAWPWDLNLVCRCLLSCRSVLTESVTRILR